MTDADGAPEERAIRRSAAAPNLCLGALYAAAGLAVLFHRSVDFAWLASLMAIEIFAIHSFPFMMPPSGRSSGAASINCRKCGRSRPM